MLPFELSVRQSVLTQKSDYLLLGLASKNGKPIMTPAVKAIDRAVGGLISTVVKTATLRQKQATLYYCTGADGRFPV